MSRSSDAAKTVVRPDAGRRRAPAVRQACARMSRDRSGERRQAHRIESVIIHTGQHYDPAMSDVFFAELGIPEADLDLGVGSGSHGRQTARMLEGLEQAIQRAPAGPGTDLRRHQLDARGDARRGEAARAGRPRRSGPAQLQSPHAGGDQPRRRRPPVGHSCSRRRRRRCAISSARASRTAPARSAT